MKLKFCLSLLLLTSFSIFTTAQDFDESFLKSLPDDIAADLLEQSENKNNLEETQYRRPTTFIQKPDPTSQRFGAEIFSMMQSTLMPTNEPNFDDSYSLDFGDQLELQLIGQKSSITKLSIKRDGTVNIDEVGKIFLSGLTLGEAINLIKIKINESFIGVDAYVTLTNVRDIQIIMAGNIFNPGSYTLSGNSNIFHALSVSGGPSEFGSFRSIDLIRDNQKIETVDLYQTFIFGKSSFGTRLRSGDIVFVNPVNNIVTLEGALKRPGEYELKEEELLFNSIQYANGIEKFADTSNIKLDRIFDGKISSLSIADVSQFKNIISKDGDKIFIRKFPYRNIEINGAVVNPGTYLMVEGDTLNDAITKAGGFSSNAYPFGGIYLNLRAKEINQEASNALYAQFLESILQISQQNITSGVDFTSILQLTTELKNNEATGRIVADFTGSSEEMPITLQDGDIISIPEKTNQVYVFGEISQEGSITFKEGEDIFYYIDNKGGLNKSADKKSIYVAYPNGETRKFNSSKNVFKRQSVQEFNLYPGSVIFVPKEIDDGLSNRLKTQAYASIIGNIGVSLASLSVLKDWWHVTN